MTESAGEGGAGDRAEARASSPATRGLVTGLHLKPEVPSEHGLPKPSVLETRIRRSGLEGDFNRYRHEEKRDDEGMAVLLMPRETIEELNREGWPVRPGDLGENVVSSGIAYNAFAPGRHVAIGEALLEISKPCTPCDNLYLLPYVGSGRGPAFLKTMVDRRGWYARVIREGAVRVGDPIELLPSP
jgi:MOSC domain-containing protein YiiM